MNIFKKIAKMPFRWLDPIIQDRYADIYGYYRGVIVPLRPEFDVHDSGDEDCHISKWVPEDFSVEAVDKIFAYEKASRYNYYVALDKFGYDMIIVDTNVFMNAASRTSRKSVSSVVEENESGLLPNAQLMLTLDNHIILHDAISDDVEVLNYEEDSVEENCRRCREFFDAVKDLKLKIHILTSQLNEISNMKRGEDPEKQFLARGAQKIIEELQNLGLLDVLDDVVSNNQSYADPEILKVVKRNQKDGCKTLVITEDRDLRIRVTAISSLAKSMNEIYHAGGFEATDSKDCVRSYIAVRGVHCGGRFICMNMDGDAELVANRTVTDEWEIFALVMNPQGSWSLQSKANGKFVCVDLNQGGKLLARNDTIDGSAEFELVPIGGKRPRFALKSKATNKYVSVCENQGNILFANGPEIKDWEKFEFA